MVVLLIGGALDFPSGPHASCTKPKLNLGFVSTVAVLRNLSKILKKSAESYPVVTVTGPRQAGKTTLCRQLFGAHAYLSFEPLDSRDYACSDPRALLREYADGAVFDEVQHVPELLTYLQAEVDERPEPGRFVLTGSQHFGLSAAISQSLAGRTAVHELFPLTFDEVARFEERPSDLLTTLWSGAYPAVFDRGIPPERWFADYVATYVQRDVRQLLAVSDLQAFSTFLKLCAGHSGQELNLTKLGAAAGVTQQTAKAWLSVLETSYLVIRLPAWHANLKKRLVKTPKLHMLDTGLLCHLLGIRSPDELRHHPQRGAVFESWVVSEVHKARVHAGLSPDLFHLRQARGLEADLLVAKGARPAIVADAKSGATIASDWLPPLATLAGELSAAHKGAPEPQPRIIYGGNRKQVRDKSEVIPWHEIQQVPWVITE